MVVKVARKKSTIINGIYLHALKQMNVELTGWLVGQPYISSIHVNFHCLQLWMLFDFFRSFFFCCFLLFPSRSQHHIHHHSQLMHWHDINCSCFFWFFWRFEPPISSSVLVSILLFCDCLQEQMPKVTIVDTLSVSKSPTIIHHYRNYKLDFMTAFLHLPFRYFVINSRKAHQK